VGKLLGGVGGPVVEEPRTLLNNEDMVETSPDSELCRLERPPPNPGEEEVVDKVVRVEEESVVEVDVTVEEGEVLDLVVGRGEVIEFEVVLESPLAV
jgi:hypothetical protein